MTVESDSASLNGDIDVRWFAYDAAGRLIRVTLPDPDGATPYVHPVYKYFYDEQGNQVGILDALNRLTVFKFNELNQQTHKYQPFVYTGTLLDAEDVYTALAAQSPMPGVETRSYYADTEEHAGQLKTATDYKGQVTEYIYNDFGQLETRNYYTVGTYPGTPAKTVDYSYDNLGRTETVVDDRGTTEYYYDNEGRVEQVDSPEGAVNYDYDPITGRKTGTTADRKDSTTVQYADVTYGYDVLGRLSTVTDHKPGTPAVNTYAYTPVGSRQNITLGNGAYPEYTYNAMNRLTDVINYTSSAKTASLSQFNYTLYADGMRRSVTETLQSLATPRTITYSYDNLNRLLQETAVDSDTPTNRTYTIDYEYDLAGNRTERTVSAGGQVMTTSYNYNSSPTDRLQSESHSGPVTCAMLQGQRYYAYASSDGGMYYRSETGEKIGSFSAWLRGLPSVWSRAAMIVGWAALALAMFAPLLVQAAKRLWRTEGPRMRPRYSLLYRSAAMLLAMAFLFGPDGFQQMALSDYNYSELCTLDWATGNQTVSYTYDANGSVLTKDTYDTSTTPDTLVETVTYTYNLQGKLSRVVTDSDSTSSTNDVDVTDYVYNDQGIRVSAYSFLLPQNRLNDNETAYDSDRHITYYLIDSDNHTGYAQVIAELKYDLGVNDPLPNPATVTPTSVRTYTIGDDVLAQTNDPGTSVMPNYLLYDGLGSTRQVIDSGKAIVTNGSYSYDGYGMMLGGNPTTASATATSLLYTGEQFDTNLQHYYLRARYYNPSNGRFNQMDPFAGNMQDPQSLHKYLYCHANPVNGTDPSGMFFSIGEAVSVQGIMGTINAGLGFINAALRIYSAVNTVIDLINYAELIMSVLNSIAQPTIQAAATTLINEIQKRFGVADINDILNGFTNALKSVSSNWSQISRNILKAAPQIAEEAALRARNHIKGYLEAKAQGRLKVVFFAPTGPGSRESDAYINVNNNMQVGISPTGNRLFGFGIRTSKINVDQIFRIDYWDTRFPPDRPSSTPLHIHYHLIDDGTNKHPADRTIWP